MISGLPLLFSIKKEKKALFANENNEIKSANKTFYKLFVENKNSSLNHASKINSFVKKEAFRDNEKSRILKSLNIKKINIKKINGYETGNSHLKSFAIKKVKLTKLEKSLKNDNLKIENKENVDYKKIIEILKSVEENIKYLKIEPEKINKKALIEIKKEIDNIKKAIFSLEKKTEDKSGLNEKLKQIVEIFEKDIKNIENSKQIRKIYIKDSDLIKFSENKETQKFSREINIKKEELKSDNKSDNKLEVINKSIEMLKNKIDELDKLSEKMNKVIVENKSNNLINKKESKINEANKEKLIKELKQIHKKLQNMNSKEDKNEINEVKRIIVALINKISDRNKSNEIKEIKNELSKALEKIKLINIEIENKKSEIIESKKIEVINNNEFNENQIKDKIRKILIKSDLKLTEINKGNPDTKHKEKIMKIAEEIINTVESYPKTKISNKDEIKEKVYKKIKESGINNLNINKLNEDNEKLLESLINLFDFHKVKKEIKNPEIKKIINETAGKIFNILKNNHNIKYEDKNIKKIEYLILEAVKNNKENSEEKETAKIITESIIKELNINPFQKNEGKTKDLKIKIEKEIESMIKKINKQIKEGDVKELNIDKKTTENHNEKLNFTKEDVKKVIRFILSYKEKDEILSKDTREEIKEIKKIIIDNQNKKGESPIGQKKEKDLSNITRRENNLNELQNKIEKLIKDIFHDVEQSKLTPETYPEELKKLIKDIQKVFFKLPEKNEKIKSSHNINNIKRENGGKIEKRINNKIDQNNKNNEFERIRINRNNTEKFKYLENKEVDNAEFIKNEKVPEILKAKSVKYKKLKNTLNLKKGNNYKVSIKNTFDSNQKVLQIKDKNINIKILINNNKQAVALLKSIELNKAHIKKPQNNIDVNLLKHKIQTFMENNKKHVEKIYSSEKSEGYILKNNISGNNIKDLKGVLSKNKMDYTLVKNYKDIKVLIKYSKEGIDEAREILKTVENIKIKKNNKISYIPENKIENFRNLKRDKKVELKSPIFEKKVEYLHPHLLKQTSAQETRQLTNNNVPKTITINELQNRIVNTIKKIENVPKYFEKTVVKVNPPDLGEVEIKIIKSMKNLSLDITVENDRYGREIEKRLENVIQVFKENYEKMELNIKTDQRNEQNQDNSQNQQRENNQKENLYKENDSENEKKRKDKRNTFWEFLRGDLNDQ
ncbi:hypothetical protein LN42_10095 [Marinitoga sp. 1137]|uniref:hypothetical protein n=1 Tax=Marinitoga sp. 1137 TaxID=1545835 RepID=UPI0009504665|nr:hypothetical protein [Marinitoga sp. 1137]APT76691.1 hypothetical protein LN42_10095 [Marinitoga sp. 1137]